MSAMLTPGPFRRARIRIERSRLLPYAGEVLVEPGRRVATGEALARAERPGRSVQVDLASALGIAAADIDAVMRRQVGDVVRAGEALAERRGLFGRRGAIVPCPIDGVVSSVSEVTGRVIVTGSPQPLEAVAPCAAEVIRVVPGRGAVLAATGCLVQGVCGRGGERSGVLRVLDPSRPPAVGELDPSLAGAVVVAAGTPSPDLLDGLARLPVAALVVGWVEPEALQGSLDCDIAGGVTGHEPGPVLVVTEGLGRGGMPRDVFDLLARHEGEIALASGVTRIRAGVRRPEIFVPSADEATGEAASAHEASVGATASSGVRVRLTRLPGFGRMGVIVRIPEEPSLLPTGSREPSAVVELDEGGTVTIPLSNLECV